MLGIKTGSKQCARLVSSTLSYHYDPPSAVLELKRSQWSCLRREGKAVENKVNNRKTKYSKRIMEPVKEAYQIGLGQGLAVGRKDLYVASFWGVAREITRGGALGFLRGVRH